MLPPLPAHRILDPEGHAALQDITPHLQFRALPAQPHQLRPLVLAQRAVPALAAAPVHADPVAQRPVVDPQLSRDLRDRLAGLPDQPDRALLEVLVELPSRLSHRPSLKAMSPRYEGKPTSHTPPSAAAPAARSTGR